ncbi:MULTISPECIES: hypothetical protein [Rhodococcus]|uniref:hypothetical protein n=1 Tax=Rhodococcus TaxID=1827 RepID=UPI000AA626E7|nr:MULTISPECIES: hypothetical protein [Rhodococcus]MCE4161631.1 hypothetical protein [Rhodococcus sp. Ni2]
MTDTWLPLGVDEADENYSVLNEEVTEWLEPSLLMWLSTALIRTNRMTPSPVDMQLVQALERLLHISFPTVTTGTSAREAAKRLFANMRGAQREWQLIDAVIASGYGNVEKLTTILLEAGSAWTVGERVGKPGLIRRVNEGTDAAIRATIANHGHAGKRLAQAYDAAYGVSPDPSRAYSLAVKAVEDAGKPIVSPNNAGTTLGTMIRDIGSTTKWKLPHTRVHRDAEPRNVLLGMMQMLWTGQHDRHGGATPPPPPVSQEEAETAVMVAATLVELFCSGKVVKDT